MIIDLFEISDPVYDFKAELSPADIDLEEETARLEKPVKIAGTLNKKIAQVDVSGKITAEIEIDCTRCLTQAQTALDFPFNVVYVTGENYTQDEEAELRAEDLDVAVFEGDKIDLSELAREQILLNLPTRFLCRENCPGLCPKCGANRNAVNCGCEEKELDPRWQGLRELNIKN
ncbi:MAG: YceD family protein [Pyrinomonadaceae bacterium]